MITVYILISGDLSMTLSDGFSNIGATGHKSTVLLILYIIYYILAVLCF